MAQIHSSRIKVVFCQGHDCRKSNQQWLYKKVQESSAD